MITMDQVHTLTGNDVYDRDGDKIGSVGQIWTDGNGQPTWASVNTGLFGMNESFVPLQDADVQGDRLVVPFEKAKVKDAPNVDASNDEPLVRDDVERLYEHYGMSWSDSYNSYQAGAAAGDANYQRTSHQDTEDRDHDTSGIGAGNDAMTRSEQRLQVGTEHDEVGRARLRKYVVTEQQQVRVPVEHEEVRLEREPITDANKQAAFGGPDLTESEHEVTLHADRAVAGTETVPVERVRLGKESITEEETVGGEVRKERIEADLPDEGRRKLD